jgi:hypothetical protein
MQINTFMHMLMLMHMHMHMHTRTQCAVLTFTSTDGVRSLLKRLIEHAEKLGGDATASAQRFTPGDAYSSRHADAHEYKNDDDNNSSNSNSDRICSSQDGYVADKDSVCIKGCSDGIAEEGDEPMMEAREAVSCRNRE